jgi:hypothetical protein
MTFYNTKYLFYKCVNCCYCFVRWAVCNLSVCMEVNMQYKHNLSCTMQDHWRLYQRITRPLTFYRELKNIYWKCHNHRWLYRRIQSVGISQRLAKYLLEMSQSPTTLQTDTVCWHFTENCKIFTGNASPMFIPIDIVHRYLSAIQNYR